MFTCNIICEDKFWKFCGNVLHNDFLISENPCNIKKVLLTQKNELL